MPLSPRMDALEIRRLFAFVGTGASTINGNEFQSIDQTLALPNGGYVSAGIFAEDTNFGGGRVFSPQGDSDVFLTLVKSGKASILTIGGSSSQDLDTDDDRADVAAEPRRVGDDFVFGVDSRIRGADEYVSDMAIGPDGKLYVALLFRRTASLNTGNPKALTLTAADEFAGNYVDSAVIRYDVSGSKLVFEDVMQIGGPFNDFIYDIDFDSDGNLFVAGAYERRMDFDPSSGVFNQEPDGRGDGFVAKYSSDFDLQWVRSFGGDTGEESRPDAVYSIAVDANDDVYVGGSFARRAAFGGESIRSEGATDAFILKMGGDDGDVDWTRVIAGDGFEATKRLSLAPEGGVYAVGYFEDDADLNTGSATDEFEVDDDDGDTDLFVTRFAADGDQVWYGAIAGEGLELVAAAATDASGDLLVAGSYFGRADFDPTGRRAIRTTADIDGDREDPNIGTRDNAYAGFVAVYGKSNARLRRLAEVTGREDEDAFVTGATLAANGQLSLAGRYRGGFGVNGTLIVGRRATNLRDVKEDGYTLVLRGDLTPIV
jgi:hypothetical protein